MQKKNLTFKFRNLNISQLILLELGEYYVTNPGNPGTIIREINQHFPVTVTSPENPVGSHLLVIKWFTKPDYISYIPILG